MAETCAKPVRKSPTINILAKKKPILTIIYYIVITKVSIFVWMKITGTQQAFAAMINKRGIHNILEVETGTVSNWRKAVKAGGGRNYPTLDLMEKMLIKAGWEVVSEKVWKEPK